MKTNRFLSICAFATVVFAACTSKMEDASLSSGNNEEDVQTPAVELASGVYPATLTAVPVMPETKASFVDGAFTWEVGDALACYQRFDKEYVAAESNILTTMWATDVNGNFSGNLPYTALTEKTTAYAMNFIYPASVVNQITDASESTGLVECVQVELPAVQDGRMEYLGDYFITGAYNVSCTAQIEEDEVISITTADNVELNRYQVVGLKVNVPEDLNIQSIAVKAFAGDTERGIAGRANINLRSNQIKGSSNWTSKAVTIAHNDESVISGATYACVAPFKLNTTPSDVDLIKFILTNNSGQSYTFSKSVADLQRGTIYDMGSFPSSCITPKISADDNGDIVLTTSPAEAKIYFTTDGQDPTTESTLYEGPIEVSEATTLKAIAVCEGLADSQVAELSISGEAVAPVLSINAAGNLVVEDPQDGYTYTYSYTTDGSTPTDAVTSIPEDGAADFLSTGTYNIKVMATDVLGATATTNACYRICVVKGFDTMSIPAGESDTEVLAPFTAVNTGTEADFSISSYDNGKGIWLNTGTTAGTRLLQIGATLMYGGKVSLAIKEAAAKSVYFNYDGEYISGNKSVKESWAVTHSKDNCESGKRVHFECANDSRIYGFGLLEQGLDAFNPASASLTNETPVIGQEIAY